MNVEPLSEISLRAVMKFCQFHQLCPNCRGTIFDSYVCDLKRSPVLITEACPSAKFLAFLWKIEVAQI